MAEVVAAIGALAAITQLIDYGIKLVTRLNEFSSVLGSECPSLFRDIQIRLPLVLNLLESIQLQTQKSQINDKLNTVQPLIESTSRNVLELLGLVEKVINLARGSRLKKTLGAIRSLLSDKNVKRLGERLQADIQILMFYQSVNAFDLNQNIAQHLSSVTGFTRAIGGAEPSSQTEDVQQETENLGLHPRTVMPCQDSPSTERIQDSIQNGVILSLRQSMSPISRSSDVPSSDSSRNGDITVDAEASRQVDGCSRSCSCVCHRTSQFRAPSFLTGALGCLIFTSRGTSFIMKACTEKMCKRKAKFSASMSYRFPPWLVAQAFHLSVSSSPRNMISSLTTMRVLPGSARVFAVVSNGTINELRSMFQKGQASIYDISEQNWTLLHSAFTLGKKDICKFLLTEGADASIQADNGSHVIERAWFHAQSNSKTPGGYVMSDNDILQSVDLDDFVQSQQYNTIHKIVLGISKLSLSQFLEASTSEIDGRDIRGYSPLSWASAQGNVCAARTLLEKGAKVNHRGAVGQTPLHLARTLEMTQLLLRYGASVESRDDGERTPLHCFCYRQIGASASLVQALLEAGAQVMAVACGGQTALHYAAMFGNTCLIPLLLRFGADINALQKRQTTPVMAAVRYDKHEAIDVLLDSSADASVLNQDGQSILHIAASYSSTQSLCILTNADYSLINANTKDAKGFNPRDYYDQRRERTPSLDAAFDRLMHLAGEITHGLFDGPRNSDGGEIGVGIAVPRSNTDANNLRIPGSFIAP